MSAINLDTVRHTLLDLHKKLLHFQGKIAEQEFGRSLTPYELWNLSANDRTFNWLRKLSELIVLIDEKMDNEEAHDDFQLWVKREIRMLMNLDENGDFQKNLMEAIEKSPQLQFEISKLRSQIM